MSKDTQKVVIVGGGFAGLSVAKSLGGVAGLEVTLIDRRNHHLFQPLLYQVAMAGLSPAEIAVPIRGVLSGHKNIEVLLGEVTSVDKHKQTLETSVGELEYDYLVLACGAKHSYFGNESWEEVAPGLKTIEQATEIRRRVLTAFEKAEVEKDLEKQKRALSFVVVGGGPTGVELAGAIGEISRFTLKKDFRKIDPNRTRVILIEAGPRVLASFDEKSSIAAARGLEELGVHVWTSSRVTDITREGVRIGEEFVYADTVLWAAGVKASSVSKSLGTELDKQDRVVVEKTLNLKAYRNIFVLGDQAHFTTEDGGSLPGLAPVALQQARCAVKNIKALIKGEQLEEFKYIDKGQLATIGRRRAVMEFGSIKISGFLAWMTWFFVHIYFLIGFKNRFFVFVQWAWNYISYSRGARLIVNKTWKSFEDNKK